METQKSSKIMHIILWIAQVIVALCLLMGAAMKFMSIEKIAVLMPWTGEIPPLIVRTLGIVDLLAAVGLMLPALIRVKPQLTQWAAIGTIVLMLSAIIFHISRGEASVIGFNIFLAFLAAFIAWGRAAKVSIKAK
ncbi:MAG: DoxX family protein [Bacteroidota bacterium]